jgi:hypothetical protein
MFSSSLSLILYIIVLIWFQIPVAFRVECLRDTFSDGHVAVFANLLNPARSPIEADREVMIGV